MARDYPPLAVDCPRHVKVWGGDRLAHLFGQTPDPRAPIGEAWTLWEGAAVLDWPGRGRPLRELIASDPAAHLGTRCVERGIRELPLLAKLIDAREALSVQVHPDDAYARRVEGQPFGKTEAWYVLEASPDGAVIRGTSEPLSVEECRRMATDGSIARSLRRVPVRAGDVVFNPAGAIHAIGAGVFLYEVQQTSDTTYRLYDWGRRDLDGRPRALHLDKALEVARLTPFERHLVAPHPLSEPRRALLCACEYFVAEHLALSDSLEGAPAGASFHALTALRGRLVVEAAGAAPLEVAPGYSAFVPAAVHRYTITSPDADARLVRVYVPDLRADVVEPLRRAGFSDDDILQLGGDPSTSPLVRALG